MLHGLWGIELLFIKWLNDCLILSFAQVLLNICFWHSWNSNLFDRKANTLNFYLHDYFYFHVFNFKYHNVLKTNSKNFAWLSKIIILGTWGTWVEWLRWSGILLHSMYTGRHQKQGIELLKNNKYAFQVIYIT